MPLQKGLVTGIFLPPAKIVRRRGKNILGHFNHQLCFYNLYPIYSPRKNIAHILKFFTLSTCIILTTVISNYYNTMYDVLCCKILVDNTTIYHALRFL